jgi:3-deoxy-manno-octulosonate cytidylyltransferase (CMP-KDO synthetase)
MTLGVRHRLVTAGPPPVRPAGHFRYKGLQGDIFRVSTTPSAKPVAIIPARYASSRFPGKPLALIGGLPMVQHVWTRCQESGAFARLIVATDDDRIASVVRGFGGEAQLTSAHCHTGTDRIAEIARTFTGPRVFINVQGDEPLIHPTALSQLARAFADPTVQMATLVRPLQEEERRNPNVVKAVVGLNGNALYFSRADVPFSRARDSVPPPRYAHVGLYGYRRETLLKLAALKPTPLEQAESLEQLRALEHGVSIRCLVTGYHSLAVDTPEDLVRAEEAYATFDPELPFPVAPTVGAAS